SRPRRDCQWRDCQGETLYHSASHLILKSESKSKSKIRAELEPVTESNRRPSPYHACRIRLMTSYRVGLPQARRIAVSGCVALRPRLPGAVVTWYVTGPADTCSLRNEG